MVSAAEPEARPIAGRDYPTNFSEFLDWFQTDSDCWAYLARLRWRDGFRCPVCDGGGCWLTKRSLLRLQALRSSDLGHCRNDL